MTQQEFDNTPFGANMRVAYQGEIYILVSVNFPEKLLGLSDTTDSDDEPHWVRCENAEIVRQEK